jgi:TRCF domain
MQSEIYEYLLKQNDAQIIICEDDKEALSIENVVKFCGINAFRLPDFRANFGDDLRSFKVELFELSSVLSKFYECSDKKIIISPFSTILNKLPAQKHLKKITIRFGDKINLKELKEEFLHFGYENVDIVESEGEFCVRGDIVDIFCIGSDEPYRILLFDDEVESIRTYSTQTQISNKTEIENLEISPFLAALNVNEFEDMQDKVQNIQSDALINDLNSLGFWVIDDFVDYISEFKAVLAKKFDFSLIERNTAALKKLPIIPEAKIYKDLIVTPNTTFFELNCNKTIKVIARNDGLFNVLNLSNYQNVELIKSDVVVNLSSKNEIIISLNKFEKKKRSRRPSIVLDELKENDYVVHSDYGVGRFIGLERLTVLGSTREFVVIVYQNDDRLLLPVEHLNLIDRYIAQNGSIATLDKLGKASFIKIKEKVRAKLFIIATKIMQMAAKRELMHGKVIQKDDVEYINFLQNAGFEYTKDQEKAVSDISDDLKSGKVMDRLLSGDVGFGKTEIAMNAIFKCVKSGFQALFFVPTTLLSSQHYKSLKERLGKFDIEVFKLDRFTSSKEKAAINKALSQGVACVCVGTHSLLSVSASNLGLIIIDEEHKFGVKQKEKLKEISTTSHLLSMSATPIPRSLNMALSSVKSYSVLQTPPSSRLDVRTSVCEWNEKVLKEAILRELRRGGQIFYIHNHIATMSQTANQLKEILPNLRILQLHSKIDAITTEDEMIKFQNGKYDLLLSTSIVESGIHMPNVNTILIENANKFGIADLHQLRGRVGRSDRQAYCYFLIEDKSVITSDALKRLVALESNSFLGSGFVIAYHDLEIRGGGNLVGEAQSGHIEAIGYSLYIKMLEEEINKLLNKENFESKNIDLKLSVNAFLSTELISEDRLRLELYRRLSKCKQVSEVYEIESEIEDRFGRLDVYTKQFLDIIIIKILAVQVDIKAISNAEQNIVITIKNDEKIRLKAKSKDDDDIINEILIFLRKGIR